MESYKRPLDLDRAYALLDRVPLIDGHNDFPYILRGWYGLDLSHDQVNVENMPIGQTDLARLRQGCLGGQFWSAFVPWSVKPLRKTETTPNTLKLIQS